MRRMLNRSTLITTAVSLLLLAALVAAASGGQSDITKARLERNLPVTFSNLYLQQASILGHRGITVRSLGAKASCDKGGPKVPDRGPGSDWICLMSFSDPNVPLPDGTAKFELNVHANGCYTAGGPSKFIGTVMITDTRGRDVTNPVFEFDSCVDPGTDDTPTGVDVAKPASATPTEQAAASAALTLPSGTMAANGKHEIAPSLLCSAGKDGCAGTLTATAGSTTTTQTYALAPDDRGPVVLGLPRGTTGPIELRAEPVIGGVVAPSSRITVVAAG